MNICFIDHTNAFLSDVIKLGRKYSATLGFMPDGGFIEHAGKKHIIIAHSGSNLVGYLMFRIVKQPSRITIVHLCINEEFRGENVSVTLLDALREEYTHICSGILVHCRSDYVHATKLWKKYGFVFQRQERSRSIEDNYLNIWWYDFNHLDLFSLADTTSLKVKVMLDANIIFKLRDEEELFSETYGISALFSDWLSDEVEYFYSPEIKNEILRDKNKECARKTLSFLSRFNEARFNIELVKNVSKELNSIMNGGNENDESDRKQIASCIATTGISYFVTLDNGILARKNELEDRYDIQIFNPHSFILEIDQLINKELYSPKQIDGVISHAIKKLENKDIESCIEMFLAKSSSEKKEMFRSKVNSVLASDNSDIKIIKSDNSPIAFFSLEYKDNMLYIPFIRLLDSKGELTLFTQIVSDIINESIQRKIVCIKILETYLSTYQKIILNKLGFIFTPKGWEKLSINLVIDSSRVLEEIPNLSMHKPILEIIEKYDGKVNNNILLEMELKLFPLKFYNLDMPCYIIPIIPFWAGQLFDPNISGETLFGAQPEKLWNIENVYYRNTKPQREIAPARILWYASNDNTTTRCQSIIGASYLDEVTIGTPKVLFQRYKHYGIYQWEHIYKLCKFNIDNNIKALRFSHTEVFATPIGYKNVQQILISNGRKNNTFQSPLCISTAIFFEIYRRGTCKQ